MAFPPLRPLLALLAASAVVAVLAACGGDSPSPATTSVATGVAAPVVPPATVGYPTLATKNTTRVSTATATATAAAVARIVFPGGPGAGQKATAVALADKDDWRAALAGAVLMAPPLRAPMLFTDNGETPNETADTLAALAPKGSASAAGAQAIRLGTAGDPGGLRTVSIAGDDPFTLAHNIDIYRSRVAGQEARSVLVVPADQPAYAMPAAAWAAKSGDSILFAQRDVLPEQTRSAIALHARPRIYVLGPPSAISAKVVTELGRLGAVTRISGATPQASAVAFARFADGAFGWRVVDPGHGLVFANPQRPSDAGAAAPLSASGTYGPLLVTAADGRLPPTAAAFLLDIKPGYSSDPVRGVYNHGWIVGDPSAVSVGTQAGIDGLLEIAPVKP